MVRENLLIIAVRKGVVIASLVFDCSSNLLTMYGVRAIEA
jgi:hypothetical protein